MISEVYADIGTVILIISAAAALSKVIEFLISGLKARLNRSVAKIELRRADGTSISVSVDANKEESVRQFLEMLGKQSDTTAPTDTPSTGGQDG